MPHQLFVKNFLSIQTPYNSLLLYHQLGTGKTCSAIGVSEEMRNYIKQVGIKNKAIMIIASPNVQDNFKIQLFNENKLKFENGLWNIKSCIGNSLLTEINPTDLKDISREKIVNHIKSIINNNYIFMGYTQLANFISGVTEVNGIGHSEEEKIRIKIKKIKDVFNNRLIIIDEVHNIRITSENKNKVSAELLMTVAKYSDNMRLLLLSATPMYNSYEEIIWLTNLMNVNDKRSQIKITDVFDTNGEFKKTSDKTLEDGKSLLKRKLTGYVSFVRGENPYTFPYRIYPTLPENNVFPNIQMNGKEIVPDNLLKHIPIYINSIGEYQKKGYQFIINNMKKKSFSVVDKYGKQRNMPSFEEMNAFGYNILLRPLESLIFVFPVEEDLTKTYELPEENTIISNLIGKVGLSNIMKYKEIKTEHPLRYDFEYKTEQYGRIFSQGELHKYSSKLAKIMEIIKKSEGIVLIYCQYIDGGLLPAALALEELGFSRFGTENYTKSLFQTPPVEPIDANTMVSKSQFTGSKFNPARYVMITGDKTFSPNNDEDIKFINNPNNKNGEKVKVYLISKAASEGIDFKNIRQVHILEPWYNMNRIEQTIGRAVRNLSHCNLPFEKRTVEIYLHSTDLKEKEEAVDLYVYRLAEKKAMNIGKVTRILKQISVDCILNIKQTNFTIENLYSIVENKNIKLTLSDRSQINYKIGDKPFTELCDYMDNCNFTCSPDIKLEDIKVSNITYNNNFLEKNNENIMQRIRDLFKDIPGQHEGKYFFKREELINSINIIKEHPIEQIYSALTELINNKNEFLVDRYGRLGHLINHGEYYMFQPIEITDVNSSIYERSNPVDFKNESFILELENQNPLKILQENPIEIPQENLQENPIDNQSVSFDSIIQQIQQNLKSENIKKSWYANLTAISPHLQTKYNINPTQIQKFAIYHMIDEIPFLEKKILLDNIYLTTPSTAPELSQLYTNIQNYFNEKMIISDGGMKGIVLGNTDVTGGPDIYIQSNDNKSWTKTEYSDKTKMMTTKDYSKNNIFNKEKLNTIIGFIVKSDNSSNYIFKIRDLTGSVNTKGANVNQALNKDIIDNINKILGSDYSHYTSENIKTEVGDGKIKLVVILEILLREFQDRNQNDKIWFLNNEQFLINNIIKYTRKN